MIRLKVFCFQQSRRQQQSLSPVLTQSRQQQSRTPLPTPTPRRLQEPLSPILTPTPRQQRPRSPLLTPPRHDENALQLQVNNLEVRVAQQANELNDLSTIQAYPTEYMYRNIDLLSLHGRYPQKYALKVVNVLFTKEELVRTVFVNPGNNTASLRTRCDEEVLKIVQNAVLYKFQLKQKELLKIWSQIITSLNAKGRFLKKQQIRQN